MSLMVSHKEKTLRNASLTFILIFLLLGAPLSYAAPTEKSSESKVKAKLNKKGNKARKRIGVDQSDFMPSANNFGFITSYVVNYDDLQPVDDKTVNHRIGLAGTYSFSRATSVYAAMSVTHQTQDTKIVRENDTDQFHGVSNLNLGTVYTYSPEMSFVARSSNTFNVALPISERSQVDNHICSFSATNFLVSPGWNRFSLYSRVTANFLWNQLRFSVFNRDQLNRDWILAGTFGVNYQVLKSVGIRASVSSNNTRYLDGSWENSFGNRFAVFSNIKGYQIFASLANFSYPENDRLDVTYFDEYRRNFTLGVTHAF